MPVGIGEDMSVPVSLNFDSERLALCFLLDLSFLCREPEASLAFHFWPLLSTIGYQVDFVLSTLLSFPSPR